MKQIKGRTQEKNNIYIGKRAAYLGSSHEKWNLIMIMSPSSGRLQFTLPWVLSRCESLSFTVFFCSNSNNIRDYKTREHFSKNRQKIRNPRWQFDILILKKKNCCFGSAAKTIIPVNKYKDRMERSLLTVNDVIFLNSLKLYWRNSSVTAWYFNSLKTLPQQQVQQRYCKEWLLLFQAPSQRRYYWQVWCHLNQLQTLCQRCCTWIKT